MGSLADENIGTLLKINSKIPISKEIKSEQLCTETLLKEDDLVMSNDYNEVCKYMCPLCNKLVDRLKTHLVINHRDTVHESKIPSQNYHKETFHKCGICEKILIFTKARIRNHIIQTHNMSINEYDSEFMEPRKLKSKLLNHTIQKQPKKRFTSYSSEILGEGHDYNENVDESLLRDSYRDVCKVQCELCEKRVDLDLFSFHLSKKHQITFADYKANNGLPAVAMRSFHKCGICGFVVLFTRVRINGHVTQKHQITMKEYTSQYLTKINKGNGAYEVNDDDVDRDVMYSNDYEDECKTVCKICNKECSYANLHSHVYQCHNVRSADYLSEFGPVVLTRKAYHECAICHKTLLFVRGHIASHVKTAHKISLHDYNREHMQFHNVEYSQNNQGERGRLVGHQKAPKWCDGTMYRCPFCHNIYYRYFTFRIHLIRSHEVKDGVERSRVVRQNEMMTDVYNCKICGQGVKKDRMDIEAHIKQVHKTTYRIYEDNLESGKVEDNDVVVARLLEEGIIAMPERLPKKRGPNKKRLEAIANGNGYVGVRGPNKRKRIEESVAGISPPLMSTGFNRKRRNKRKVKEEASPEASFNTDQSFAESLTTEDDDRKNVGVNDSSSRISEIDIKVENEVGINGNNELPAKRRRRIPAKLSPSEFEVGLNPNFLDRSSKETIVKTPNSVNKFETPNNVQPKASTKIKQNTSPSAKVKQNSSPLKKTSPKPKLSTSNNNINTSSNKVLSAVIKSEPVEKHIETSDESASVKEVVETKPEIKTEVVDEVLMYRCPLPGCEWVCTREGMRKGPAVLHLLRIHKIQPIEMRQRGIKFVTV